MEFQHKIIEFLGEKQLIQGYLHALLRNPCCFMHGHFEFTLGSLRGIDGTVLYLISDSVVVCVAPFLLCRPPEIQKHIKTRGYFIEILVIRLTMPVDLRIAQ